MSAGEDHDRGEAKQEGHNNCPDGTLDGKHLALKIIPVTLRAEECLSVLQQLVQL